MSAARERPNAVKFRDKHLTVIGPVLKAGDKAPDFKVLAGDMSEVSLAGTGSRTRLFNVVPSLDTPVCQKQTVRFNQELAGLPAVDGYVVSVDLPFAQKRVCGDKSVDKLKTLSDHRDVSFGQAFGVAIKELRLLQRAVFVVDGTGTVRYAEYVPEVGIEPNYDAALAALRQASGA